MIESDRESIKIKQRRKYSDRHIR